MVLPKPVELYLPKEVRKIILRKVIEEDADGKTREERVNKNILEDLEFLKKYLHGIKIEREWVIEKGETYSKEKTKITFYFPNISYEIVSKDYDEKSKTLKIDLKYYLGPVIL